jgi:hypothetical protein
MGCSRGVGSDATNATEAQVATAEEIQLAKDAQDVINGAHAHCNQCHTASRSDVLRWAVSMHDIQAACFDDPPLDPVARVACMSAEPSDPNASFSPGKLGFFAAGATVLQDTFMKADPTGARFQAFKSASMPMGSRVPAMTADEFEKVEKWVSAGIPAFNAVFGSPPEPEACVPNLTDELKQHVADMKTQGWGARLADDSTPMFGCGSASEAIECLKGFPAVSDRWPNAGVAQTMRMLRDFPKTNYWIRSSADGRFVGYGQETSAAIVDLTKPAGAPPIQVDARYDPSFFPNNDGVSFAGTDLSTNTDGPIRVCKQSALVNAASAPTSMLTLKEAGCTTIIDSVYQSVGASLDGAAFWMATGSHVNDDGGNRITGPLDGFDQDSVTQLTPMVSDGLSFKPRQEIDLPTPLEGDQILSPSSKILITRFGSQSGHQGYTLRKITTKVAPDGTIGMDSQVVGRVCGGGGKAMMSFDERFVVTHRYADPMASDVDGGAPISHSDIMMTDLLSGDVIQVTNMGPNQYALYPHFRADGWMYFLVRDLNGAGKETLVATDVALKRTATAPH